MRAAPIFTSTSYSLLEPSLSQTTRLVSPGDLPLIIRLRALTGTASAVSGAATETRSIFTGHIEQMGHAGADGNPLGRGAIRRGGLRGAQKRWRKAPADHQQEIEQADTSEDLCSHGFTPLETTLEILEMPFETSETALEKLETPAGLATGARLEPASGFLKVDSTFRAP